MFKLKIYILLLIIILISDKDLFSQKMSNDFRTIRVLSNKDTLVVNRKNTDFWFGFSGGFNDNWFFGKLNLPQFFDRPLGVGNNILLNYESGSGTGYFFGLFGEWTPKGSDWGVNLNINLMDIKNQSTQTNPLPDSLKTYYLLKNRFNYLTCSPSARYNFNFLNLYAFGGLDIDFLASLKSTYRTVFQNTEIINQDWVFSLSPPKIRIGAHLGIGYEFIVADMYDKVRVMFTPYLSVNGGSNVLSDFGSSRNSVFVKLGINVKFSIDEVQRDTLKFDSTYQEPLQAIASAIHESGVSFPGFYRFDLLPAMMVNPIEKNENAEEVAEASTNVDNENKVEPGDVDVPETQNVTTKKYIIQTGVEKTFTFQTSTATTLNKEIKDYLDAVADFMKSNPGKNVRIVGHSDDQGTFTQNQQRSEERALQVVQYLVSKGIPRSRLFDRGDGARNPKGDNRTEAGRRKNRRVEIVVVQQ
jgi:outer membrane protein OmpA-like peptidoglycan-associated protein